MYSKYYSIYFRSQFLQNIAKVQKEDLFQATYKLVSNVNIHPWLHRFPKLNIVIASEDQDWKSLGMFQKGGYQKHHPQSLKEL